MQKETPATNDLSAANEALGENLELLILHKAYIDLSEDEQEEEKENDKD